MGKYKIQVFTGTALGAGTSNKIYINLIGSISNSGPHKLKTLTTFWPGSKQTFTVESQSNIGELLLVEVEPKPRSLMPYVDDDWFCTKIIVTTPEGVDVLFPCHCWMSRYQKLTLRHSVAMLKTQDTVPLLLAHRHENLKKRRQEFKWSLYAPGLPHTVLATFPHELPPEVRFSFTKDKEFLFTSGAAFTKLKLEHLLNGTWNSFEDINRILSKKPKTYEYVEKNWMTDEFFAYQFLNGLNPMIIKRCSKLPEKFPVTNEMVKSFLPDKSTLESEMKKGNIFICDYERLRDLEGNQICRKKQYLAAPLCLLFSTHGKLMPIAIQLNQQPGPGNPIFLPSDSENDWLLAKIFVRSAEFNEHELNFHLLRTHLMGEVFTVATMRNLPSCHPLYKLLIPHTRYNLQINIMARNLLISEIGYFPQFTAIGNESMTTFLKRAASSLTYSSLCMPDDIKERGLETIPNCYYRDDGLELWDIVYKFVSGFVSHYYSDQDVKEDNELHSWLTEIRENGFLEHSEAGFPKSFCNVKELAKFVTMVIFTVSGQHSAVNNGQFDFGGFMPNFPSSLRCPPPRQKGETTRDSVFATLPDISTTINTIAIVYLLSQESADRYPLGHYPEELFGEEAPLKLIAQFKSALQDLEMKIDTRNKKLVLPYIYMNPRNVDNSVAI
ncbi:polyunsaturated fatty acid lipoxygenase ALOX15B-like [Colossoma macropomum]|uniref:polyunsaturated fatty acid lipoxygenase ALOX15B-like n=1 Tax=Colossoma macropomum TaxID=42526 RepID=UPI001863DE84|nr:polyunsaturated fatty acid lipoxygenase ALOX15B-like [Colossoma macropomum]